MIAKQIAAKSVKYSNCFDKLDNEGSGFLNVNHLTNLLVNYKDGLFKDQVMEGKIVNEFYFFGIYFFVRIMFFFSCYRQKVANFAKW
jgi:hypothetical protein